LNVETFNLGIKRNGEAQGLNRIVHLIIHHRQLKDTAQNINLIPNIGFGVLVYLIAVCSGKKLLVLL